MKTAFADFRILSRRSAPLFAAAFAACIACAQASRGEDAANDNTDAKDRREAASRSDAWQQSHKDKSLSGRGVLPPGSGRLDKLNLDVDLPGPPWVKIETPRTWRYGGVFMARTNPDIMLMLNGQPTGVEMRADIQLLAKAAKAKLTSISPATAFTNEKDETINGIRGRSFEASMYAPSRSEYWLVWVGTRNGYSYELVFVGNAAFSKDIAEASRDFRRGMSVIDSKRVAHKPAIEFLTRYKSKNFGYDIDLTGLGWAKLDTSAATLPLEVYGLSGNGSGVVVLALPMPDRTPNMEVLATAVIKCIGLEQNGTKVVRTTPYQYGDLQCSEIETVREVDGKKVLGRMRLVSDDRCAYVMWGWSLADFKDDAKRVEKSLDRFNVHPRQSVDVAKLPEYYRDGTARIQNEIGMQYHVRGDDVVALEFFSSAMKLAPTRPVCIANYLEVLAKLDRTDEAIRYLDEHKELSEKSPAFQVLKAKLLLQKGDAEAARRIYADLIHTGKNDDAILIVYIELAIAAKEYDEALATVAEVMEKRPTVLVQRWNANLYELKGDTKKAVTLFEELRKRYPDDVSVAVDLAGVYEHAEQYDDALAITQKLIDSGTPNEVLFTAHSRVLLHLGRNSEAKQVLERAHELFPASEQVSQTLKMASSQLGEGENSCLKKSIEPVAPPEEVTKAIEVAESRAVAPAADCDAEEMTHIVGLSFEPGKSIRKTTTQRVKIYTASGVTRYGMIQYKLNPLCERLFVNKLVVTDEHGKNVAQGSVDNYFLSDEASGEASSRKTVKIPVPGLKPGYTLECTVTREILGAAADLPFQEASLACESPARVSAFFVKGDVKRLKWKSAGGAQVQHTDNVLYCVNENVAELQYEPNQPAAEEFTPTVWIGPAGREWSDEAQKYLKLIEDRLPLDDSTRALAADVTRGCKTKREKLAAIAEHVQQGYRYHAIEFGQRARVPNAAAKTISLKYGDCKDHALLTKQLLAASGIKSHLTAVRSSGDIVAELPSLDQFDHVVVFVPADQVDGPKNELGGLIVDTTNKEADPLLETPYGLEDRSMLVLDPKNPRLVRTPKYPADAGKLVSARTLTFDISTAGVVESRVAEDVTLNGYLAPGMRAFFKHFDGPTRREALQNLLSDNGPIRVKRVEPLNLSAVREPLRVHLEYTVPNSFHAIQSSAAGKSLIGSLPCAWESQYVLAPALDARKTPFEVAMPRMVQSALTINLPTGYRMAELDRCNGSGHSIFRSWISHVSQEGQTVKLEYEVHLATGQHPATAYEEYYADSNESLAILRTPITLEGGAAEVGTASRPSQAKDVR